VAFVKTDVLEEHFHQQGEKVSELGTILAVTSNRSRLQRNNINIKVDFEEIEWVLCTKLVLFKIGISGRLV
jgi:hypothetical protein